MTDDLRQRIADAMYGTYGQFDHHRTYAIADAVLAVVQPELNRLSQTIDWPGPNLTPGFVNEPGSASELLPAEILAAIDVPPYLSTACDTALRVEPADVPDATGWARRLHARCRLNNKFTGAPCPCTCHDKEAWRP